MADLERRVYMYNGIDGATGRYLPLPSGLAFSGGVRGAEDHATLRELRWWKERYGIDDPERWSVFGVDPKNLASAGWGVIFAPNIKDDVRSALSPLLKHRQDQAGMYYKTYTWRGQSKQQFLISQGASPGPANPKKIPYYLLIVGDPTTIPFKFQYDLDVQYGVGRISFESAAEYASYAQSVVDAETGRGILPPKEVTLFGVCNPDDPATDQTLYDLIDPLAKVLKKEEEKSGWRLRILREDQATKEQLGRLLGGGETPALLFTASHGMRFPVDDGRLFMDQGALLCQDWPGPDKWKRAIPKEFYFSAADVGGQSLLGLIAFHLACHSAGTPDFSDFDEYGLAEPQKIAPHPFISHLPQRLLSGGALAVLGHIDRAWTTAFNWSEGAQIEVFESMLKSMLDGYPVGSAMEYVNQKHAELSVSLKDLLVDRVHPLSPDRRDSITSAWQANNDARNFVVLGDPAVRLIARES